MYRCFMLELIPTHEILLPYRFLPRPGAGAGGDHPRTFDVLFRVLEEQGILDEQRAARRPASGPHRGPMRGDGRGGAKHHHEPDLDGEDPDAGKIMIRYGGVCVCVCVIVPLILGANSVCTFGYIRWGASYQAGLHTGLKRYTLKKSSACFACGFHVLSVRVYRCGVWCLGSYFVVMIFTRFGSCLFCFVCTLVETRVCFA